MVHSLKATTASLVCLLLSLSSLLCQGAMTDSATGIDFSPSLNGLNLFGVGVRKKGPIKVSAKEKISNEAYHLYILEVFWYLLTRKNLLMTVFVVPSKCIFHIHLYIYNM